MRIHVAFLFLLLFSADLALGDSRLVWIFEVPFADDFLEPGLTSICLRQFAPLLVLKGIHHYWIYIFSPGGLSKWQLRGPNLYSCWMTLLCPQFEKRGYAGVLTNPSDTVEEVRGIALPCSSFKDKRFVTNPRPPQTEDLLPLPKIWKRGSEQRGNYICSRSRVHSQYNIIILNDYHKSNCLEKCDWVPRQCPFTIFFWGVPLLKSTTEKSWHPYSNLSTEKT